MQLQAIITDKCRNAFKEVFNYNIDEVTLNLTKPEFEGDFTVVLFSYVKTLKLSPEALGQQLGTYLTERYVDIFSNFNVIKGFLNLSIADKCWTEFLSSEYNNDQYGKLPDTQRTVVLEYASPNTNKPLHLGHLRNIFLGWSLVEILKAAGNNVIKTCVVNDRGIHICKSMVAWQLFGNGQTPESTGIKGDHFVGDYYVKFNDIYKEQVAAAIAAGSTKEQAEKEAPVMQAAQKMLLDWEAGDTAVIELWSTMNQWVYKGFDTTYQRIGADFFKTYYESQTYLLGKQFVAEGLESGVFYKKEDGSVWIDLTDEGLDEKLVIRKDGTSVYITQDLGLAEEKYKDFAYDESIYVIGDEQNYHMKVLQLILKKLGKPYANGIYHLSYGMVELPSGKMKSREGTVVDADDILDEMINEASSKTAALGKVNELPDEQLSALYDTIGIGGLKFFLLRVEPKRKMIFNPAESIDLHGFTATFIQYAHARIKSILREATVDFSVINYTETLLPKEKELLVLLNQYPATIEQAAQEHNPSLLAIYAFNLSQLFNSFYSAHKVLKAESTEKMQLRLQTVQLTAHVLKSAMALLGIQVPEKM